MRAEAATNVGLVRKDNEDSFLVSVERGLFVVADGMGGHLAGQVASALAVQVISEEYQPNAYREPGQRLREVVLKANAAILNQGLQNPDYSGMGTTITAAAVKADFLYISHIGDSRAYLYRDGRLQQLTQDHSLVNELFKNGSISLEEMQNHPQKNILTSAAGTQAAPRIDSTIHTIQDGDFLLLCTDGLHGHLDDADIEIILGEKISLTAKLDRMIGLALERGGTDNITGILADMGWEKR